MLGCPAWVVTGPVIVHEGQRYMALGEYPAWWQRVEDCSGLTGPLHRVEWYKVPGRSTFWVDGKEVYATWDGGHRIYVAEPWVRDSFIVQHEMLHDLIGKPGHPSQFDACGLRIREVPQ